MGFFKNILSRLGRINRSEKIRKDWIKLANFYRRYLPTDFSASMLRSFDILNESSLTYVKQEAVALYPVLRFMCRDLHDTLFKERTLTADEALSFIMLFDLGTAESHIRKWREEMIKMIIEQEFKQEDKEVDSVKLSIEKRKQELLRSRDLFTEIAKHNAAFIPRYVMRALEDLKGLDDLSW